MQTENSLIPYYWKGKWNYAMALLVWCLLYMAFFCVFFLNNDKVLGL